MKERKTSIEESSWLEENIKKREAIKFKNPPDDEEFYKRSLNRGYGIVHTLQKILESSADTHHPASDMEKVVVPCAFLISLTLMQDLLNRARKAHANICKVAASEYAHDEKVSHRLAYLEHLLMQFILRYEQSFTDIPTQPLQTPANTTQEMDETSYLQPPSPPLKSRTASYTSLHAKDQMKEEALMHKFGQMLSKKRIVNHVNVGTDTESEDNDDDTNSENENAKQRGQGKFMPGEALRKAILSTQEAGEVPRINSKKGLTKLLNRASSPSPRPSMDRTKTYKY